MRDFGVAFQTEFASIILTMLRKDVPSVLWCMVANDRDCAVKMSENALKCARKQDCNAAVNRPYKTLPAHSSVSRAALDNTQFKF